MRRLLLTHTRAVLTLLVAALVVVGLLGLAAPASAHGDLVDGSPGPGDEVAPGSTVLRLDLDAVDGGSPLAVALLDDAGDAVPVGGAELVDGGTVCAATEPLTEGVWTVEYAGTGEDGHRFGGRYAFEAVAGGEAASPGACAGVDLAEPGEAMTVAEMIDADGVPVWVIWGLVGLALLAAGAVVVRVRRDRVPA